jgi:hypothetical protein
LQPQAAKEALVALQIKFKSRYVIQQYTPGGVADFPRAKDFEVRTVATSASRAALHHSQQGGEWLTLFDLPSRVFVNPENA